MPACPPTMEAAGGGYIIVARAALLFDDGCGDRG
jgi:hypothetical protein